ncbi:callisulfakinin isoform X2 [Folsomia candida]|uniref:callisulfakinin isoform X2 n=1 Tax=Folsomia candida TaxID=158441 RepID=UPI00160511ED|nr:callisulfakinin isoform X2 [Folsomia candida]
MSKFTVFATIFVLYACAVALGLGDPSSSNLGGGLPGVVSPKNVRILSPAATRLYRMIRKGVSFRLDDDDLFAEDENNFRKRQYDDYGHMRFGKRNQPSKDFDDYGHLRFGK